MPERQRALAAVVDYGVGNLFSVKQACERAGLAAEITNDATAIARADAVILPGVGAFGDAMAELRRLGLVEVLRAAAASGTPLLGICLGMQLLMDESCEFGRHEGLGIIPGRVLRLEGSSDAGRAVKVPQVGWNHLRAARPWQGTLLAGLPDHVSQYFVHSFYVRPDEASCVVSTTRYGGTEFCSSLQARAVFACQFHPERSGADGLQVYRNFAARVEAMLTEARPHHV